MNIKVEKPLPHPTIVSFPQGLPINVEDLELLAGKKGKERNEKIQVVAQYSDKSISKVVYKGGNFGESAKSKNCYKYAVGVVDESDPETITLYPTDHIYVLRPNLDALVASQSASLATPSLTQRLSTASASERRESLTNEFGSKKKKRALQAMKSNIISSENIYAGNELETSFTGKSIEEAEEVIDAAKQALASGKKKRARPSI